jgi:flagellar protein FlaG
MDAISNNSIHLASYSGTSKLTGSEPRIDEAIINKMASTHLPSTKVKESSQELKNVAESAMKDIQHFISSQQRAVRISKDDSSGHMVVQLLDPNSGEVIRTLPSEELLRLARSFEMLGNKLVHQVA